MRISFQQTCIAALTGAVLFALFLLWLWRPERQLERHTENLLRAVQKRDWTRFASFIATDYHDQWGNDRALLLTKTREIFRYVRALQIGEENANFRITKTSGFWSGLIRIEGDNGEVTGAIKERVNSLKTPFQFEWQHLSGKPWDWQLVQVSNSELQVPEFE